ncbi:MAG: cysteine--tRNA ligase [Armatimonadetes bacterium]|nr:cysteine--tRNA ligase [Armatimonadota bacterium]
MGTRTLHVTNTLTRQLEAVQTQEPDHLRFYSCGPTVYSYAHIGNFRTFLTADLVVRVAEAIGWKVSYVSNITDVGHLTQDDVADAGGEDKMEKALHSKEGEQFQNVWDLARHYANAFIDDWDRLRLKRPLVWPRATEHMREQIEAVEKLIESDHAYVTPTGVYFRLSSFPDHGKLSGNRDKEQLKVAVRDVVQDDNKEHPGDFALWKLDDKHLMQWYSPWGWGFPGWHIECSVMAMKYLGETLDLHAGGEDLVFPHHESEIAQSECLTGHEFCPYWIHTRFLQVNGEKMSKSKGNWYTVRDLVDGRGVDPVALRYALISVPYGKPNNFTDQTLKDAARNVERMREARSVAESASAAQVAGEDVVGGRLVELYDKALDAMCEDLNTAVALAQALEGAKLIRESLTDGGSADSAKASLLFLDQIDALLGIAPPVETAAEALAEAEPVVEGKPIAEWIALRTSAKASKDFATADQIRQTLDAAGIELRDTPDGVIWKRKTSM